MNIEYFTKTTITLRTALVISLITFLIGMMISSRTVMEKKTTTTPVKVVETERKTEAKASAVAEAQSSGQQTQRVTVELPWDAIPARPSHSPSGGPTPSPIKITIDQSSSGTVSASGRVSGETKIEEKEKITVVEKAIPCEQDHTGPKSRGDLSDPTRWGLLVGTFAGTAAIDYQLIRQPLMGIEASIDIQANHVQAGAGVSIGGPVYFQAGASRSHMGGDPWPYVGTGLRLRF
jgi:hypothetical protein